MPIKVMAAPKAAQKLLRDGIEKHLAAGLVDATLSKVAGLAAPHRVFHLGLDALVAGTPIAKAAQLTGWRALLVDRAGQAVAAAELASTRAGLRFASVSRGPHAAGSSAGEKAAERWSQKAEGDFELALLRVPGAYCTALWLRSADGAHDVFVPVAPCPPSLEANEVYPEERLRQALLPEARKQLAGPTEGGGRTR
ncbi:MAG TPA: hypothetical protein VMW35_11075 [Myxococcota bacterium]|jgi:hypothetical protein|nr:hypothetical protein [Myxococcota bacterium]